MNIVLWVFLGYFVCTVGTSIYATILTSKKKSEESYAMANKSLDWKVLLCAAFGVAVGGTATVGAIQGVYAMGIAAGTYGMARGAGSIASGMLSTRVRKLNAVNPARIFSQLFNTIDEKYYTFIMLIVLIGVNAAQIKAAAAVLPIVLPMLDVQTAILVCSVLFFLMTLTGGLMSASLGNIVNTACIWLGIIICLVGGLKLAGGWNAITSSLPQANFDWLSYTNGGYSLTLVIAYFVSMVPKVAESSVWLQVASAKSSKDAKIGFVLSGFVQIILAVCVSIIGIIAVVLVPGLPKGAGIFSDLAVTISPIAGALVVAGIFAAAISCSQTYLISCSYLFNALYKPIVKGEYTPEKEVKMLQVFVFITAVASYIMAVKASSVLTFAVNISAISAPFGILMLAVFFYPKILRKNSCSILFYICGSATLLYFFGPLAKPLAATFKHVAYFLTLTTAISIFIAPLIDKRKIDIGCIYKDEFKQEMISKYGEQKAVNK